MLFDLKLWFALPYDSLYAYTHTVACIGFQKGGGKFSLAISALTPGGNYVFQIFSMAKKFFLPRAWPNAPLNTPLYSYDS